ncbi:MAG: alkaline phosphatase family protein [Bacteroidota bacterium]
MVHWRACSLALLPVILSGAASYPMASPAERKQTLQRFREAAKRSVGPRSGDLFALPEQYNFFVEKSYSTPATASVPIKGAWQEIETRGTVHATSWDYDSRIPLVFYGPGYVPAGKTVNAPVTQQDLVPTYAHLLKVEPPEDAAGRPLEEGLKANPLPPKAILTVVFDQGGEAMLRYHPHSTPFVRSLMARGTAFTQARVTHADAETFVGHIGIGTGAYPGKHGVPANNLWLSSRGGRFESVDGETAPSPVLVESPSFADLWLRSTKNRAIVVGQSLADRAAIGMVGHGSLYRKNKKPFLEFFDSNQGVWSTNDRFYALHEALKPFDWKPYAERFTRGTGLWLGHKIDSPSSFRRSAAVSAFEGEAFRAVLAQEPVGQDEVTDLLFLSFKGSDYVGHTYGQESREVEETLQAQDAQLRSVVEQLEEKVGKDRLFVIFTADHGGAPLPELSGGVRLIDQQLLQAIDRKFDHLDNGVPLAEQAGGTQIFLHDRELRANRVTLQEVKSFLKGFKVQGKPFFAEVFTRDELK